MGRIQEKMRENRAGDLTVYHHIIDQEHVRNEIARSLLPLFLEECGWESVDVLYHTEVRWLSGAPNRCLELREEIYQKGTAELRDAK